MYPSHEGAHQALNVPAIPRRARGTIVYGDAVLLTASLQGMRMKFPGIVEVQRLGNPEHRPSQVEVPLRQPFFLWQYALGYRQADPSRGWVTRPSQTWGVMPR